MRNLLYDVHPEALSLVTKGANRKRFFLRKGAEDRVDDLLTLPAPHRLVKAEDWSAVYCVVAEPGWEEDPGMGAPDQDVPDVWRDEEEIRKAAHRFMQSGALVNCMHKALDRWGDVVENYIAPADFSVAGETIKKGSWVIAITPNDEGREAIESGEFTGISIEGIGSRDLIEKAGNPGSTGAMVALYPTPELATELAIPKGESPGDLHLTLAFLGDAGDGAARDAALAAVRSWAAACPPLAGEVSGVGHFVSGENPVTYLSVDLPDLPAQREALVAALEKAGQPAAGDHGFTPHMTLAYSKRQPKFDAPVPVTFDRATLAWAGEQTSVPLGEKVAKGEATWSAIDRLEKGTTGYLCSNCGHFMPATEARDRAACPECKNRFRNAPVGYLAKAAGLPEAIAKDAILVPNKPGVTNWIERAGGLPKFMADVAGDLISEKGKTVGNAIQMAIGIIRNWTRGQGGVSLKTKAKAIAALAEYEAKRAKAHIVKGEGESDVDADELEALTADPELIAKAEARASIGSRDSLGSMADRFREFFRKLGSQSGIPDDELDELLALEKAHAPRTFADVISQRDFEDELPDALDALRSAVYNAFYPMPNETDAQPGDLIAQSLDEFKAWALKLLEDSTPATVAKINQDIADAVCIAKAAAAVTDRAAQVKEAFAAAHKKYPDGLPKAVSTAIIKDPAKWLAANAAAGAKTVKKADTDALSAAREAYDAAIKDAAPEAVAVAKLQLAAAYKAAGADVPEDLAKFDAIASIAVLDTFDFEMGLTPEELERVEKLEQKVDALPDAIAEKVAKAQADAAAEAAPAAPAEPAGSGDGTEGAAAPAAPAAEAAPNGDQLTKQINDFIEDVNGKIAKLGEGLDALAAGDSSQGADPPPADPNPGGAKLKKAFEDRELNPALAGIAGD